MCRRTRALVGPRMAAVLIVFAVLCQARNAAADGCYMSGPGFVQPQLIDETHPFGFSILFQNDIFYFNGGLGVGAVPCLYDLVWAGPWHLVYAFRLPDQEYPSGRLEYPFGILQTPTYGPRGVRYNVSFLANGPNPRCVARYGEFVGVTVLALAGSGYPSPDSGAVHFWRNVATVVQGPRPKQALPDGTLRCFPDTTGNRVKITTKTRDMSGRG